MRSLLISFLTFVLLMGGAMLGARFRAVLPKHHLAEESKDIARVAIGFLVTMCALVMGLLIATAKTSFDTRSKEVLQAATKIVLLDRNLRQYGPEADPARQLLHRIITSRVGIPDLLDRRSDASAGGKLQDTPIAIEEFQKQVRELSPTNESQRLIRARALQLGQDLAETRWLAMEQPAGSIPTALVVLLILWLMVIATCIGVFSPRTRTLAAVGLACSLSAASAIFLILEMDRPFGGLIQLSDVPLRDAIIYLEQ